MPTVATPAQIRQIVLDIRYLSPTLNVGTSITSHLRQRLEELADCCGLAPKFASKATNADLISIYLVAAKDPRGGERVAQRIAMRLDDTLLCAPSPITAPSSIPEPSHTNSPHITPPISQGEMQTVLRAFLKDEIKAGALDPLQAALRTLDADLRADFDGLLDDARRTALAELQEAMVIEAQAAAAIALKDMRPTLLDVTREPAAEPVALGLVHKDTPKIINALSAGVNVYLHGPAGSGKTTVGHKCAEAFGLSFYFAAKVESEYQLMGFKDAKGETVRTQFREAYEHGGVFLFDEMDASSPSAVVALNAALANGMCPFPDGIVKRHKDFLCLGAGNTKLTGATRAYAGRNQLDAASIDRFAFIHFGYDDELEMALATDHAWAKYVQRVRRIVADRGLNHLVTPRATYDGCKLLAKGFDPDTVADMVVYKGLDADTVTQIKQAL